MRALLLATLLGSATLLALAPTATADSTCNYMRFPEETDQTGALTCRSLDWLLWGGTSPLVLARAYANCYVYGQPPGYWVPNCS